MARGDRASTKRPGGHPASAAGPRDGGGCAALEAEADRLCRAAEAARVALQGLSERLVAARADQTERRRLAAEAEAAADPGGVHAARGRAQAGFQAARQAARSTEEIAAAASAWLDEIERVNAAAAESAGRLERERAAAEIATAMVEHLAAEAESARVASETAEQACVEARGAAQACAEALQQAEMERRAAEARAAKARAAAAHQAEAERAASAAAERAAAGIPTAAAPGLAPGDAVQAAAHQAAAERALGVNQPPSGDPLTGRARTLAASTPIDAFSGEPELVPAGPGAARAVVPGTVIHRILSGDLGALSAVADRMGGDPETCRRWEGRLTDLLEAILLRAVDASAVGLPADHPFWGTFTPEQSRDIMSALSALGCRFDGLGGWLDDRTPTQRDLSLAVAHAGLDPMRIRHWPTIAEAQELVRDAEVLGAEYLGAVAPGLTLREMTSILGQDALPLADVWLEWERIRELLVAREPEDEPAQANEGAISPGR